jgi:chromosomal replication initiator protein
LVIEDLQRLRPRATIQQELRDAIDAIIAAGGLVIVTAQREPAALDGLDRGLDDRLAAGLTIRLQNPGPEARQVLVSLAAAARGLVLTEQEAATLAQRETGAAAQVIGSVANGRPSARSPKHPAPADAAREHDQMKQILAVTARYFAITQAALTGPSRRTSLVAARNIVVHLARRLTTLSYADIGRALGNRDHTTIMHAQRRLDEQRASDPVTQQTIDELDRLLR